MWSYPALADEKQKKAEPNKSETTAAQEKSQELNCSDVFIESGGMSQTSARSVETSPFQIVEGPDNALRRVFLKLSCLIASV
jgi:hypothetical protein